MRTGLIIFILSWASNLLAQDSSIYFEKLYDYHKGADGAWSMVSNGDGTYIVIGSSLDPNTFDITLLFMKFDRFGDLLIKKGYRKAGYQYYTGFAGSLIKTHDNGYAFGGSVKQSNANISDGLLVKFNAIGDTEFMKAYGDTAYDYFSNCLETDDHGFIMVGQTFNFGAIKGGTYLVKTDSLGNFVWKQVYYSGLEEICLSISNGSMGNYTLGGGVLANFPFYIPLFYIVDSSGKVLKRKTIPSGAEAIGGIQFSKSLNNSYIVYGALDTTLNSGDYQYPRFVAKYDSNLNESWKVVFNDPIENGIFQARQFSDSTIIAVGFQGDEVTGAANGLLAKISNSGKLIWKKEYYYNQLWKGDPLFNYFYDVQQAPDKGYVMCGFTQDSSKIPNQDIWLVKLDSNGCLQPGCDTVTTGIVEVSDSRNELKLFPNPAQDFVSVLYNIPTSSQNSTLEITDVTGKALKKNQLNSSDHYLKIDISNYHNQVLFFSLMIGSVNVSTKKLVVIK